MHAGHFLTFLMVRMTKFKQLLRQEFVLVWLSSYCELFYSSITIEVLYVFFLLFLCTELFLFIYLLISSHPSPSVLIPALRTVGNIVTGDDLQTQVLLVLGLSSYIFLSINPSLRKMKLNKV